MVRYALLLLSASLGSAAIDARELSSGDEANLFNHRELDQVIDFSSDDLRDVCETLEGNIPKDSVAGVDICECELKEGSIDLACNIEPACISSNGMEPMLGDFSLLVDTVGVGEIESFSQTIGIKSCFQYPSDLYDGQKVCYSTIADGLGTNSQCRISVGESEEDTCLTCRFCQGRRLTFDCTNLGYEDRSNCTENNIEGSILQFLYEPELVDTCPGLPSSGDGGSSSSTATSSLRAAAYVMMAFVVSVCSTWMV